jgi:hypothetical protein
MSNYIQIWREFQPHEYIGMTDAEGDMAWEIEKLRARVAMLERVMQEIAEFCEEGDRRTFVAIANTVRAALEVKP